MIIPASTPQFVGWYDRNHIVDAPPASTVADLDDLLHVEAVIAWFIDVGNEQPGDIPEPITPSGTLTDLHFNWVVADTRHEARADLVASVTRLRERVAEAARR